MKKQQTWLKIFPVNLLVLLVSEEKSRVVFLSVGSSPPRRRSISHESVCLSRMERRLKAEPSHLNLFCMLSRAPPRPPSRPPQIVINAVYGPAMTTVKGTTEDLSQDYLLKR